MSMPGVGDVVAVTELCWRLYRQVYQVYRDAPAEIDSLGKDLSSLTNILKSVEEDIQQPHSTLSRAGSGRVTNAVKIVQRTGELLSELEKLLQKHEKQIKVPQSGGSGKSTLKASWAKFKYTKDARKLTEFRTKIDYQAGQLTLLLLSSGNSSLERLRDQNDKIAIQVDEIERLIRSPTTAPDGSSLEWYDDDARHELNMLMLQNSEINGETWSYIGFESWLQACQWWLMKAQAHLHLTRPRESKHIQAYVNLLKASWIFSEILTQHPQRKFASSGQQNRSIQRLGEVLKAEHIKYSTKVEARPTARSMKSADFTVWGSFSRTSIFPNSHTQNDYLHWSSGSGEIIYQRFGYYKPKTLGIQLECIILVNVLPQEKSYRLVAQTPDGRDTLQLEDPSLGDDTGEVGSRLSLVLKSKDVVQVELTFLDSESCALLKALLEGASFLHSNFPRGSFGAGTLTSVALLNQLRLLCLRHVFFAESDLIQALKGTTIVSNTPDGPNRLFEHTMSVLKRAHLIPEEILLAGPFQQPCTIVSLLAWAAVSTENFRNTMTDLASQDWGVWAGEILQAAILLEKPLLARAILDHFHVDSRLRSDPEEDSFDESNYLLTEHFDFVAAHLAPRMLVWTAFRWCRGDV